MQFRVSHGFIQGNTHRVCQDYTTISLISGLDLSVQHNPLIIVSDGCSEALDSDVGARIIALTARKILEPLIAQRKFPLLQSLGNEIRDYTVSIAERLGLSSLNCAATLLAGFVIDGTCHVYFFGDGIWFRRLDSGELLYTTVESFNHTPGYLTLPNWVDREVIMTQHPGLPEIFQTKQFQQQWQFPANETLEFGLMTDGVLATDRSTLEVIEALSGDKVDFLIDQFLDTRPVLNDDIGVASIRIEENFLDITHLATYSVRDNSSV
jgi:hypothetical protein